MSRKLISDQEKALEAILREEARRHLMPYVTYMWSGYIPARHLKLVAEKLEQVELFIRTKGKEGIGRLMVFMPPRMGKTELVGKFFPSWFLGRNPDKRVMITSYGADLAETSSRAVRNLVLDLKYRPIFGDLSPAEDPITLSEDSRSKANWDLAKPHRGGVSAAGVGGAVTGKGADLLIVDDPYKNRDDAESEAYREKVDSWWKSSAYTRLEDGAAVVIVHTRWHPDDLAGMLLKMSVTDPLADKYEVVFLPALALDEDDYPKNEAEFTKNLENGVYVPQVDQLGRKPGEELWPEKYSRKDIERIRINSGPREFASLQQQLPRPMKGNFFDDYMFNIIKPTDPMIPKKLNWVRYVDLAMGQSERSDWNATLAMAMDDKGRVFCRGMLRVHDIQEFLPQLKDLMLMKSEANTTWGIETVGFQSLVFQEFQKDRAMAKVAIYEIKPEKDKVSRAQPIRTRGMQGLIFLIDEGDWIDDYLAEMRNFPTGKHDDQVDTTSGGLEMIAEYGGPLVAFVA